MLIIVLIIGLGTIYFLYRIEKTITKHLDNIDSHLALGEKRINDVSENINGLRMEIINIAQEAGYLKHLK